MKYNNQELINMYKIMQTGRLYDKKIARESKKGKLVGMYHFGLNQEALEAGLMPCIGEEDYLKPYHRNHGMLQMCDMKLYTAGMMGKVTGYNNGIGGDYHQQDIENLHLLPIDGLIGSDWLYDTGFAYGLKRDEKKGVVVSVQGDGASMMGSLYESLNFASLLELPIVYIVVNNSVAMTTPVERYTKAEEMSVRAESFSVKGISVWGQDPVAVREVIEEAMESARKGQPCLVEVFTYRKCGHYFGDPRAYESADREAKYMEKYPDPIERFGKILVDYGTATEDELKMFTKEVKTEIDEAFEWAYEQPDVNPKDLIGSHLIYSNNEGGRL